MTNEDVIDLYNRVKIGSPVVVLALGQSDSPFNPRMAFGGNAGHELIVDRSFEMKTAPDQVRRRFHLCNRRALIAPATRLTGRGRGKGTSAVGAGGSSTFHWQIR